jgi:hypothetical protein
MARLENLCTDLQHELSEMRRHYAMQEENFQSLRKSLSSPLMGVSGTPLSYDQMSIVSSCEDLPPSLSDRVGPASIVGDNIHCDGGDALCWKFDEIEDLKLESMALDLDTSLFLGDDGDDIAPFTHNIEPPGPSISEAYRGRGQGQGGETVRRSPIPSLVEVEGVPLEEPRVVLQKTLASMPSQTQKEFLQKLVKTIKEMFPHVSGTDTPATGSQSSPRRVAACSSSRLNKENVALERGGGYDSSRTSSLLSSPCRSVPSPALRPTSIVNSTPLPLLTDPIEQAQQQAISLMAALLPNIQIPLLNIVTASMIMSTNTMTQSSNHGSQSGWERA